MVQVLGIHVGAGYLCTSSSALYSYIDVMAKYLSIWIPG